MNKRRITEQILNIISDAEAALQLRCDPYISKNHDLFQENLNRVTGAFCGSWLGYHANVYYQGFSTPRPGDGFSVEWGLRLSHGTGGWVEVSSDHVFAEINKGVDPDYETRLDKVTNEASAAFDEAHSGLTTLLAVLLETGATTMLEEMNDRVNKIESHIKAQDVITYMTPKGTQISRDMEALSKGLKPPPHVSAQAWHMSEYSRFESLTDLVKEANKLLKYMDMHDLIEHRTEDLGTKVFIGHGRSPLWREFKDFIESRLSLRWDEYNREPTAGLSRKERLQVMLDQACFAFLVMTAEDMHADKTFHARENVIHEVGLFQGRLGFRRAIVLLEEGCEEFSNIEGLDEIRFLKGNISSCFEDIRRVLEREGVSKP